MDYITYIKRLGEKYFLFVFYLTPSSREPSRSRVPRQSITEQPIIWNPISNLIKVRNLIKKQTSTICVSYISQVTSNHPSSQNK